MILNIFKKSVIKSDFDSHFSNELHNKIQQIKNELDYPSLQISFIIKNKKFNCSTGFANVEKKKKARLNSVYYLGSVSKIYVKAIILRLIQDNAIALDDTITKYIDISPFGSEVTLKHLLHHRSGLYDPIGEELNKYKVMHLGKRWTIDEILNEVRNTNPSFTPGSSYHYSNVDYILLGIAAEKVTNKTFSHLLKEYFLSPLKLTNTYYSVDEKLPKVLTVGYDTYHYKSENENKLVNVQERPLYLPTSSFMSGAFVASSADVCEFMHNLFEGSVLNEESKRSARLFFGTKQFSGVTFREQTGYMPGYKSFCGYSASLGFTFVTLSNISDQDLIYNAVEKIVEFLVNSEIVMPIKS